MPRNKRKTPNARAVAPGRAAGRRDADKERRREAILEAATELFAKHGLENVTFGDIAEAAGLSRPLVYFYFPDRETLFFEAVARSEQALQARFATAARPHLDGRAQITAIGRAYLAFLEEQPSCFHLVAAHGARKKTAGARTHPMEARIDELHARTMAMLTDTLARGVKEGVLRRDLGDLLQVAVCLWAFTHGLAQIIAVRGPQLAESHGLDPEATIETAFDLLTRAIIPAPKAARSSRR